MYSEKYAEAEDTEETNKDEADAKSVKVAAKSSRNDKETMVNRKKLKIWKRKYFLKTLRSIEEKVWLQLFLSSSKRMYGRKMLKISNPRVETNPWRIEYRNGEEERRLLKLEIAFSRLPIDAKEANKETGIRYVINRARVNSQHQVHQKSRMKED